MINITLPCGIGDTVYVVFSKHDPFRDSLPCAICKHLPQKSKDTWHISEIRYMTPYDCKHKNEECCELDYWIEAYPAEAMSIYLDKYGKHCVSIGHVDYDGFEPYEGCDGKVYFTIEEAEAALIELRQHHAKEVEDENKNDC